MGNRLVWNDRFNIGVEVIDKEHKRLFSILNKILASKGEEDKNQWICQEGIKFFKEHAVKHFADEEAYMLSIDYPEYATHKRVHDDFRQNTLPALEKELNETDFSTDSINHFFGVCAGWLIGHTMTEDRAITKNNAISKWVDLLPEEEQSLVTQTIMQLMSDMFQLKPKVVSECYGGEKFGDGIYYRMIYGEKGKERWEIILVFEEKLILNTIGALISSDANTLNEMMVNAARYSAQQFVLRIREHYPSAKLYEMKEENLLTYEQFQKVFERNNPQYSYLFDTGAGYFSFCIIAPHLLTSDEKAKPIRADNAMKEIKAYLSKNGGVRKNKILVVDDSDFALAAMKELLCKDYEVSLAKSGMAAIRTIILDRPDLVLLDYEMPVCDGRQVLEMIRAEEELADVPVIFLTGRSDKESVQKVIALKPAGYLVKTQKPADIKKGIDSYFEQIYGKKLEKK